ncbi:MAG: hypothetical protein K2X47_04915 [Bdellovibrionales bacterium]|nr:hypothetical protein [Bdellovibrionales bacterium]
MISFLEFQLPEPKREMTDPLTVPREMKMALKTSGIGFSTGLAFFLGAGILLSYQNCGPITKKEVSGYSPTSSIAPTPTTLPALPVPAPDPFANSKLAKCLRPQIIAIPNAVMGAAKNAYILARGVVGDPYCPDPRVPYLESYKVVTGTAGVSVETMSLGGDTPADPIGMFDATGQELYIFAVGGGMSLYYRTVLNTTWIGLGGVITILPNTLCDPNKRLCRDSGFDVVNSFNGKNEFHFVTISGVKVFLRNMNEYWVDFGGAASSAPIFARTPALKDVLQVVGGGELCYQSDVKADHLLQDHPWMPACE